MTDQYYILYLPNADFDRIAIIFRLFKITIP